MRAHQIEKARELARIDMSEMQRLAPIASDIAREIEMHSPSRMALDAPMPPASLDATEDGWPVQSAAGRARRIRSIASRRTF